MKLAKILSVSVNQDSSYFCVGTTCGFRIYSIEPFSKITNSEEYTQEEQIIFTGGISLISILYKTQILALVGAPSNKKLGNQSVLIYDSYQRKKLQERPFVSPILNALMLKDRLVVVLHSSCYIFNLMRDFSVETHIKTCPNPRGLFSLNASPDKCILATLGSSAGIVAVHNLFLQSIVSIPAFRTFIQYLSLSPDGLLIGAANDSGSIFNVYDALNGVLYHSFKRGLSSCLISSVGFDFHGGCAGLASDTNTIHLYFLNTEEATIQQDLSKSTMERLKEQGMKLFKYLPGALALPTSSAKLHLKDNKGCNWTATESTMYGPVILFSKEKHRVHVVTPSGQLYKARYDPIKGGECTIEKVIDWFHSQSDGLELRSSSKSKDYNPFGEEESPEEELIEEYFGLEEVKIPEKHPVVREEAGSGSQPPEDPDDDSSSQWLIIDQIFETYPVLFKVYY